MSTLQVDRGDFSIAQLVAPTSEPLTLQQAKEHLRLDPGLTDFDNKINLFIAGARAFLEGSYSVRIMPQKVEVIYSQFPRQDRIRLPIWPVQSADYFKYVDTKGQENALTIGTTGGPGVQLLARLHRKPAELVLPFAAVWPAQILTTADAIRIGLTCGFNPGGSPLTLPLDPRVIEAMCLMLSHWWDNGAATTSGRAETSAPLVLGLDDLMADVRLYT